MGVFRSDEILQLKIRMPGDIESAIRLMDTFGNLKQDALEFIDLTKDDLEAKRNFAPMLNRCEIMETSITNLITFANEFTQSIYYYSSYQTFINELKEDQLRQDLNFTSYFDLVENELLDNEKKTIELIDSYNKIKEDLIIELEKRMVFQKFFTMVAPKLNRSVDGRDHQMSFERRRSFGVEDESMGLLHMSGIIKAGDDMKMNRMILRASHGRAMVSFFDFYLPEEFQFSFIKDKSLKKIFIIFYPSEGREVLLKKLLNICDLLSASMYKPPDDHADRGAVIDILTNRIKEKKDYLLQAEGSIRNYLKCILGSTIKPSKLDMYRLYFRKERMIYLNLSKCILRENFIDGEVWVLKKERDNLERLLNLGGDDSKTKGSFIDLEENDFTKPTYIPTNDFLYPFQEIVNTYGIPRYQEINPAYFNIVTFPFLFGVMFGDIGHGLIIFCFGLYLCIFVDSIRKGPSILQVFIKVRYFLLLLGIASLFCGLMYNDFLSIPLPIFKSCYDEDESRTTITRRHHECVYPIGFDPRWYISTNELQFMNSFKMKFSVIFGVIHMVFGIALKGLNDIQFNQWLNFIFEFIPELIFMTMLFGYMIIMIVIKWSTNWSGKSTEPPSLITLMINIFIKKGSVNNMPVWGDKVGEKYLQEQFNRGVLIVIIILLPIMIFPKPLIEYLSYSNRKRLSSSSTHFDRPIDNNDQLYVHASKIKQNKEETGKNFIDFFINQSIEMIEFILGTVSNTASYLRLWALSLAHVELTKVFFEKTLLEGIIEGDYQFGLGFIEMFIGYFLFANITLFVLIGMDFMECFLHTLRLHWVEFQSKFYKADGYLFVPFSFKYLIDIHAENV